MGDLFVSQCLYEGTFRVTFSCAILPSEISYGRLSEFNLCRRSNHNASYNHTSTQPTN